MSLQREAPWPCYTEQVNTPDVSSVLVSSLVGGAVFAHVGDFWLLGGAPALEDGTRTALRLRDGAETRIGPAVAVARVAASLVISAT